MKWVSNLPDDEHTPYKFITAEPDYKTVVRYFRPSDYAIAGATTIGFPLGLAVWERYAPSVHPRVFPKLLAIQVPFFFTVGVMYAYQRSLYRFWGWTENKAEYKRWLDEESSRPEPVERTWSETDW
ncbi:hypothetical protein HK105_204504 [Polyrhizophydium stewartii]|uniref:NADH-ubiquinone oxidoreductase 21kDa subunit N-terminal domain-containing protein n=1 Tax=Polyrhizophydium stewartii TaxID=2732419 RepID=A0ABR4N984_9FUNG|nr:hypothetical protein HK105_003318 [Polyrhizophydium stewartii]